MSKLGSPHDPRSLGMRSGERPASLVLGQEEGAPLAIGGGLPPPDQARMCAPCPGLLALVRKRHHSAKAAGTTPPWSLFLTRHAPYVSAQFRAHVLSTDGWRHSTSRAWFDRGLFLPPRDEWIQRSPPGRDTHCGLASGAWRPRPAIRSIGAQPFPSPLELVK